MNKTAALWVAMGFLGLIFLPWYSIDSGFWSFQWMFNQNNPDNASALLQVIIHKQWWFLPSLFLLAVASCLLIFNRNPKSQATQHIVVGALGLGFVLVQVFLNKQNELLSSQGAVGTGALITIFAFLFLLTTGLSCLRRVGSDAFITGLIGTIVLLVATFVFFPISHVLIRAFEYPDGSLGVARFLSRILSQEIWGLNCFSGQGYCGPAINSLILAVATGIGTTLLGLSFALIATRTLFPAKKTLRVLTVLPIITPPFVIGLSLILLFGRSGVVTEWLNVLFDVEKSRWLYGFTGVYLSQLLSFTPIAFLVLIGVVEGVSPSMEEASLTMRANRWQTFKRVSFPLMKPGLANAFLLGFIESLADFGNPLVLGGDFNVLSTEIYFAIVGAVADTSRAAVLGIALLTLTVAAFLIQRRWLGNKSYTSVTGKGDSGQHSSLNPVLKWTCYLTSIPWAVFTLIIYGMILYGSFVSLWGYDNSFTLKHYQQAFGIEFNNGLYLAGSAWDSFITTLQIASIAAPLTALVGLLTAYLLVRQNFAGKSFFEFGTMLSFAIPGTVVGISYIMAFNVPPIELTGTGLILIVAFMFRNMPVGVRGGIAALSQLDKSLDEASLMLGATSLTTLRRVITPLMGPAILAALIYSFVRAITSVSAVIFLVSAEHNMATSFIVGRVENGEFGIAIAYSVVLIITMLAAITLLQVLVGKRNLRKGNRVHHSNKNKIQASNTFNKGTAQ
ncbi:MAG: ABC transporter permease [Granulosicoccus sp.]